LKGAAGVCGGCGQAMGIESTFACNTLNALNLAEKGESRFRTSSQPMIPGVSHAQRPPRQRLRSNGVFGNYNSLQSELADKWDEQVSRVFGHYGIASGWPSSRNPAVWSSSRSSRSDLSHVETEAQF
jgi:hypothetical protein